MPASSDLIKELRIDRKAAAAPGPARGRGAWPWLAGAALLVEGAQVVTDFVHFLRDGEPVQVVGTRELRP